MSSACVICSEILLSSDDVSKITPKGLNTLISSSLARNDGLVEKLENMSLPLSVHTDCRKEYTRSSSIKSYLQRKGDSNLPSSAESKVLRSCETQFDFKHDCLFCGEDAIIAVKLAVKRRQSVTRVETIEFRESILDRATERNDNWGDSVLTRVQNSIDLIAVEARYHHECRTRFFLAKAQDECKRPRGRPEDETKAGAFLKLCSYLDNNDECQYSLSELLEQMDTYLDGEEGYTTKHLQLKLSEHYGAKITITSIPGKPSVLCFRDVAHAILHENWYSMKCTDPANERKRIVETAASIIREDIRMTVYNCDTYPSSDVIQEEDELVPDTLKCFMKGVIKHKGLEQGIATRRRTSVAHALIAACRPRSFISPLLLAIGTFLHRKYASRELIDILSSLSFAHNYSEIQGYEYSMIAGEIPSYDLNGFVQFVFDNADFNVHSLDGHNTFHSMGGIACVTPASRSYPSTAVPRICDIPSAATFGSFGKIPIKTYNVPAVPGFKSITIKDVTLPRDNEPEGIQSVSALNSLWLAGYHINVSPCPSWSGFMQEALKGGMYDTSRVIVLPFINLDPNSLTTIHSALHFAQSLCEKYNISTCPVTFDQPLYIKAAGIVSASTDPKIVFVRLGGFHLLMSFMGSIGNIMAGSGLEELWESVYAKGSVVHMMSGHAYSRALRAHILTQAALGQILLQSPNCLDGTDTEQLKTLYEALLSQNVASEHVVQEECVKQLTELIVHLCDQAAGKGRTATLWINYFKQVAIMHLFIRAERTGDWRLHLQSVKQMLPYFHAAGHLAYAKSAHLYIQQMMELHLIMPEKEYRQFTEEGYFTIRRTDKFWSGIFSDQTIEQFLMRLLKTSGGMTRGRGITDSTLARWVHALPLCVPICNALETFTSVHSATSDQHKDLRPASQSRDKSDLDCFVQWLEAHPPFIRHESDILCSLSTGIIADGSVNCDNSLHIGQNSMEKMTGKTYSELTLRRKDKVKSLGAMKNTIKVRGEDAVINPSLMFNRITCILNTSSEMEVFLQYELAPQPPSLFLDGQIRKTTKSGLGKMLKSLVDHQSTVPDDSSFIIDGGYLLHAVVWPKPGTYQDVCEAYKAYVTKHYHVGATVVFDGYDGPPSTKSAEQNRRAKNCTSADIVVAPNLPTTTTQGAFLGNNCNKTRLIQRLSTELSSIGIIVKQAESDADRLIVTTALQIAELDCDRPVVVVGTDTDLLVMLIARAPSSVNMYMLCHSNPMLLYSVKQLQHALGSTREHILFIHAITGCDTTSALYGQGKLKALKLAQKKDVILCSHMDVFALPSSTHKDVATAGEQFLLKMYGAEQFATLNKYRHVAYKRSVAKTSTSSSFKMASLPPTSAAAQQHSYRVYLQVQQWLGHYLPPTDWGWKTEEHTLAAVATDQPAAPETLLKLVSCGCQTGCGNACGCRKAGMVCSDMCINCMGVTCSNTAIRSMDNED